jgi:DNA invertase Pin-like site-specific DNA recombinase
MDVIGIIRVSRAGGREGESFTSPSEQRQKIEDLCTRQGNTLLRVEDELDISGGASLEKRAGLKNTVESVESG